jgi:hypothetical protein
VRAEQLYHWSALALLSRSRAELAAERRRRRRRWCGPAEGPLNPAHGVALPPRRVALLA